MGRSAATISAEDLYEECIRTEQTLRAVCEAHGVNFNTARGMVGRYIRENGLPSLHKRRAKQTDATPREQIRFDDLGETAEATSTDSARITTLEQLLAAGKVDARVWKTKRWTLNKWDMGAKQDDGSIATQELFQVKAYLERRQDESAVDVLADLLAQIRAASPVVPAPKRATWAAGSFLLVPGIADVHFGKRSADGAWTLEHAVADFHATVDALIARVTALGIQVERVMFPVGNDALHVDSLSGATTKGTLVETSISPKQAAQAALDAYIYAIERLADLAPVDAVVIPGNHDALSGYTLGLAVWARFHNDKRVTVDKSDAPRKYYQHGQTLIGMAHGDSIKAAMLPTLMATEAKDKWSACSHYEWLLGHFHRAMTMYQPITSDKGVTVRVLPALCPADTWHTMRGFLADRAAEALLYHREHGPAGTFPVFVDEIAPDHTQDKRRTPAQHGGERSGGGGE